MKTKEKIETLLRNYKKLKANIEIELNRDYPEYSLDSVSFVKTGSQTNAVNSDVENYVVDKYSPELEDDLVKKIQARNIIYEAVDSLTEKQQEIIKKLYYEDRGLKIAAGELGWSQITMYRRKNEILKELKSVGILAAWNLWEEIPQT